MIHVGVDTQILIWGFRDWPPRKGTAKDVKEKQRRSRLLLEDLFREKTRIVVPSISLSELLCYVPAEKHGEFIATMQATFFVKSFDAMAASLAAGLFMRLKGTRPGEPGGRNIIRADAQIVATVKAAGASSFYSDDEKCRLAADLVGLKPRLLPSHAEDLFAEADSRREMERTGE